MRNSPNTAFISFNESEFKYLLELMKACGMMPLNHMRNEPLDMVIAGMQVRVRKSLLRKSLPLFLLAYYDSKHKRPVWMKKLRILLN
jgi:hypothetical protein